MAPPLRGADAAATSSAASSLPVTNPSWSGSATYQGDVILLWCASNYSSITFSCTGFTALPAVSTSRGTCQLLWKVALGTEGSSFTVSASTARQFGVIAISYSGENQAAPLDPPSLISGIISSAQSTSLSGSGITLNHPGDALIWFGAVFGSSLATITVPSGYTVQVSQANSGTPSGVGLIAGTSTSSANGATGTVSGTASATTFYAVALAGIPGPVPAATFVGPAGWRPRFSPKLRRGAFIAPAALPQANQGTQFPLFTSRSGWRPRWAPKLRRGAFFAPVPPQASQGTSFPLFTRQGGYEPKWPPKLRRGSFQQPGWGQANQGTQFPLFIRGQPGWHPRWSPKLRRGAFFLPGWGQAGVDPAATRLFRPPGLRPRWASRRIEGGRVFMPGLGQGNQGVNFPLFTRQAPRYSVRAQLARVRPGRTIMLPYVPQNRVASASWHGAGSWSASAFLTRHAAAAWQGSGSMEITGVRQQLAAASWSGAGRMQFRALVNEQAVLSWSGSGTMSIAGQVIRVGALSMAGAGSMTISASDYPALRMQGAGSMSIAAVVQQQGALAMSAAGSMQLSGSAGPPGRLILIGPGAVTPPAEVIATGAWQHQAPAEEPDQVFVSEVDDGQFDEPDE
jgi:hypothetical protein